MEELTNRQLEVLQLVDEKRLYVTEAMHPWFWSPVTQRWYHVDNYTPLQSLLDQGRVTPSFIAGTSRFKLGTGELFRVVHVRYDEVDPLPVTRDGSHVAGHLI